MRNMMAADTLIVLSGEEIPICSRIIAVSDAYDAMVTDRPYRKAATREEIAVEITRCKGSQFDPPIAEYFADMIRDGYDSRNMKEDLFSGSMTVWL